MERADSDSQDGPLRHRRIDLSRVRRPAYRKPDRRSIGFRTGPFRDRIEGGAEAFSRDDLNQVWDYVLDLKNFHRESHAAAIVPILVATHASRSDVVLSEPYSDGVYPPVTSNRDRLSHLLVEGLRSVKGTPIDAVAWTRSPYQPTPTIIEAARALYSRHSVEDISRHDAGARNLRVTSQRIDELIEEARNDFDASARTLPRQGGDKQRTEDAFHRGLLAGVDANAGWCQTSLPG